MIWAPRPFSKKRRGGKNLSLFFTKRSLTKAACLLAVTKLGQPKGSSLRKEGGSHISSFAVKYCSILGFKVRTAVLVPMKKRRYGGGVIYWQKTHPQDIGDQNH